MTATLYAPRTTTLGPSRMAVPPPDLVLFGADREVGWISGTAIRFCGFGSDVEAVHAAWIAYRTLARCLARTHGERPVPVDGAHLALDRRRDPAQQAHDGMRRTARVPVGAAGVR